MASTEFRAQRQSGCLQEQITICLGIRGSKGNEALPPFLGGEVAETQSVANPCRSFNFY